MRSPAANGIRCVLALLLSTAMVRPSAAQKQVPPQPVSGRPVPQPVELSKLSPFALEDGGPGFHILSAASMSEQDRDLLAHSETSLRRAAALQNISFGEGDWKHVQLQCPSFPHHLLLRFERNNGSRDVSIFSAAISRGEAGRVMVLPILRRSYAMFAPAPRNAHTIAIFNRLLREEKTAAKPDWVSLGSCYAAFSDQSPEIADGGPAWRLGPQPVLRLYPNGRASIRLETLEPNAHVWELKFARNGQLLAASSTAQEMPRFRRVPEGKAPPERSVPPGSPNARPIPKG